MTTTNYQTILALIHAELEDRARDEVLAALGAAFVAAYEDEEEDNPPCAADWSAAQAFYVEQYGSDVAKVREVTVPDWVLGFNHALLRALAKHERNRDDAALAFWALAAR